MDKQHDLDPQETREWLDSLDAVLREHGAERGHFLLEKLIHHARLSGLFIPFSPHTAYINTIPNHQEAKSDGNPDLEWRIRSLIRWNALAMVIQANRESHGIGGHIASFQSAATLYDVGFNHFFKGAGHPDGGDLIYIQGHCAPGIYARAFLEGRLSENQLHGFRRELSFGRGNGLSSYPHPYLMPEFWQFATVSMGLGPIMAIYQARFLKYMQARGFLPANKRKIWCFCGDGEMDEPESLGAIDVAARENLDNLIFVVNCNLQRLDGPVRGDGKIIQELEGEFRGAGWNVIKVIWGSNWDGLLAQDHDDILKNIMLDTVDGEYQTYKAKGGAYTRAHFFGKNPELLKRVAHLSDEQIQQLNRGGHDPHKLYAAYYQAVNQANNRPTVILAKTVKGYGMGEAGEGQNITHQQKAMGETALKQFRDRFKLPIEDAQLNSTPFYKPDENTPEIKYLKSQREKLGGYLPKREVVNEKLILPELNQFEKLLNINNINNNTREISTTMAFVQLLQILVKDAHIGKRIVPIVPDEARTFGMEGMFKQLGIYAHTGQLYEPQDAGQLAYYREAKDGQILEEGITEAGAMSSWIAAATAYANVGVTMLPFYIFYSMFGFQRIGDLAWAAGDMRARGFLLGATAGRTTLNGEGLQHQDGHSLIIAATVPNCISYDPCYAYELAIIIHHGFQQMYVEHKDIYYYLTLNNENYKHLNFSEINQEKNQTQLGVIRGCYLLEKYNIHNKNKKINLMGSGTILNEIRKAAQILAEKHEIICYVWSVTSFTELARDAQKNPQDHWLKTVFVNEYSECDLTLAASDYMQLYAEQIRAYLPVKNYITLGTDGFGCSDTREALRAHFGVDAASIVHKVVEFYGGDNL